MSHKKVILFTAIGVPVAAGLSMLVWKLINKSQSGSGTLVVTSHGAYNNPGNIKKTYDSNGVETLIYKGEIPSPSTDMKSFSSMAYGFRAMMEIIRYYYYTLNLKNIYTIIARYSGGDNVDNYAEYVGVAADINEYTDIGSYINSDVLIDIVTGMAEWEQGSGFAVDTSQVKDGYNLV